MGRIQGLGDCRRITLPTRRFIYRQHESDAPNYAESATALRPIGDKHEPLLRACPEALAHLTRREIRFRRAVGVQGDRVVVLQIQPTCYLRGGEPEHRFKENRRASMNKSRGIPLPHGRQSCRALAPTLPCPSSFR